jgi:hypothetical protein
LKAALGSRIGLGNALGSPADGGDVAGIKIAKFNTVVEKNSVALPVEAVSEKNFALGTSGDVSQIGGGDYLVFDS